MSLADRETVAREECLGGCDVIAVAGRSLGDGATDERFVAVSID